MIRPVRPEDIERGVWHLDEPMTDLSAIPLMLLCERVRQDVIFRGDAPPTLCITGDWETDRAMRAEENLYFVAMMKFSGHKHVKQIVIEGADHGRCGKECWPHVTGFIEKTLAERD